jgi:very-short-patch-repair endonuclease
MKPDEIAEQTGISKTTIYANMPQELKDKTKVEAGKLGGEVSGQLRTSASQANQTVTTQDTSPLTIQDTVKCERCGVNTSKPKLWHGHQLCDKHYDLANLNSEAYDGYFRTLEKEKNGQIPQLRREVLGSKESWEQRKAVMSPQHSKMEELILQKLDVKPVVTDRSFCLQSTTPDFYFPSHNLAVYLDGQPHEGREDRDEALTALLEKRHGLRVLRIKYKGTSDAEQTRVLKEIVERAKP